MSKTVLQQEYQKEMSVNIKMIFMVDFIIGV